MARGPSTAQFSALLFTPESYRCADGAHPGAAERLLGMSFPLAGDSSDARRPSGITRFACRHKAGTNGRATSGHPVCNDAGMRLKNAERIHYNASICRSDAAYKECENPFSPITRLPRNKKGRQVPGRPGRRITESNALADALHKLHAPQISA